jgi:hypothetical protein
MQGSTPEFEPRSWSCSFEGRGCQHQGYSVQIHFWLFARFHPLIMLVILRMVSSMLVV